MIHTACVFSCSVVRHHVRPRRTPEAGRHAKLDAWLRSIGLARNARVIGCERAPSTLPEEERIAMLLVSRACRSRCLPQPRRL